MLTGASTEKMNLLFGTTVFERVLMAMRAIQLQWWAGTGAKQHSRDIAAIATAGGNKRIGRFP